MKLTGGTWPESTNFGMELWGRGHCGHSSVVGLFLLSPNKLCTDNNGLSQSGTPSHPQRSIPSRFWEKAASCLGFTMLAIGQCLQHATLVVGGQLSDLDLDHITRPLSHSPNTNHPPIFPSLFYNYCCFHFSDKLIVYLKPSTTPIHLSPAADSSFPKSVPPIFFFWWSFSSYHDHFVIWSNLAFPLLPDQLFNFSHQLRCPMCPFLPLHTTFAILLLLLLPNFFFPAHPYFQSSVLYHQETDGQAHHRRSNIPCSSIHLIPNLFVVFLHVERVFSHVVENLAKKTSKRQRRREVRGEEVGGQWTSRA